MERGSIIYPRCRNIICHLANIAVLVFFFLAQAIYRTLSDEPDGMVGLDVMRGAAGVAGTLKQRTWQHEHAEDWAGALEVMYCMVDECLLDGCLVFFVLSWSSFSTCARARTKQIPRYTTVHNFFFNLVCGRTMSLLLQKVRVCHVDTAAVVAIFRGGVLCYEGSCDTFVCYNVGDFLVELVAFIYSVGSVSC